MTPRPLDLLEESSHILRPTRAPILLFYWTGALPFAIALLWLLRDAGLAWGGSLLFKDSLLCALAFLWSSYWKSLASHTTFSLLSPVSATTVAWPARAAFQAIFQTPKLFVMPLAIASLIGWPAASAFFRTLALEPAVTGPRPIRDGYRRAFASATDNYKQNAVAFLTVAAFAVILFLNLLAALAFLPSLWRMLTGYETDWSRLETPAVVFSLFSVTAIATWLLLDPWIQTYSILRTFYRQARSDGGDLLRDIARIAAILFLCLVSVSLTARAEQPPDQRQALDQAIHQASQNASYGWLHPPDAKAPQGFLGLLARQVSASYISVRDHVRTWYRSLLYWLRDLFGNPASLSDDSNRSKPHAQQLRWTLAILAVLICGLIVALFLRTRKIRQVPSAAGGPLSTTRADVFNEQILPGDVSQEEWLRLAFQYLSSNQTRLAARAFYLANLSYLGAKSLLSLSLSKSTRLYERELARQPKSSELSTAFTAGNRLYERAWFGMRELAGEQTEMLKESADQLRHHA